MAKEQTTMSRCFSDTPCQLSELPDIWHCLDLLRSGTAAANLETAHPCPHLSFSVPVFTEPQGLESLLRRKCSQNRRATHPSPSSICNTLAHHTKENHLVRTPISPTKYHVSSQEAFHCMREGSNLPALHRRCWQEECCSA